MGIFSFFSRDEDDEDELMQDPAAQSARQSDSAPTGELYEGMRLDVMTKEGEPLLSGRVIGRTEDSLNLGRLPGELSFKITTLGKEVSLSGYDKKLLPICLSATVQASSRTSLTVFSPTDRSTSTQPPGRDQRRSLSWTSRIFSPWKIAARVSSFGV